MIAAILVVPLIYFINAFLIGRLIKRWKISVNPFLATIVGFIALFDVIYIISIWMYAARAIIWSYFVVFGVIQGVLVAMYIANWRYIFLTWSVDYKKIITFSITLGLVILIGWLNFREFNSEFGKNFLTINHFQNDIWKPMWFGVDNKDIVSNFSAFNIMNIFWADAFHIKSNADSITFCNWSWTIIAAGIAACLTTWMVSKETAISRLIFSLITILVYVVLTLAFIESYAIGDAWVLLLLFIYILVMVKDTNSQPLKLFILTTFLIGFLAISCTSFFTVICVWIFSIYYVIRNKQNSLNYTLFLSWPLMLTIFSLLSIYSYWLLSLMNALYLIIAIVSIAIFRKLGTPVWDTKIAMSVYRNSAKITYVSLGLFIAIILVANFFIFQEIYKWSTKNINYQNFLTFTYTYLWTINITSVVNVAVFNAVMYVLFLALAITYLVVRNMKRSKWYVLFKTDSVIKFGIVSCILFINPLVIHVLKISTAVFPLNTLDLNILFVAPIFVFALKANYNHKYLPANSWKYNWY
ncbi:MAG: hypothetical protein KBS35_02400 [Mycoplasma sp.]|nr:hypothetical protein [Candidatus Hennigella equi]